MPLFCKSPAPLLPKPFPRVTSTRPGGLRPGAPTPHRGRWRASGPQADSAGGRGAGPRWQQAERGVTTGRQKPSARACPPEASPVLSQQGTVPAAGTGGCSSWTRGACWGAPAQTGRGARTRPVITRAPAQTGRGRLWPDPDTLQKRNFTLSNLQAVSSPANPIMGPFVFKGGGSVGAGAGRGGSREPPRGLSAAPRSLPTPVSRGQ